MPVTLKPRLRKPPGRRTTRAILQKLKPYFKETYGVEIENAALDEVVEAAARLFSWRAFPGKAVELLKEAVAEKQAGQAPVGVADVYAVVQKKTGLRDFIINPGLP